MTRYDFPTLTWRDIWTTLERVQYDPYVLRNRQAGEGFVIEGDPAGFVQLGIRFLMTAAEGFYAHMESRERVPHAWMFESGLPVKVGDSTGQGRGTRVLSAYSYESRPIQESGRRELRPGAECDTAIDEEFYLSGNFEALLSLADHCFDLAHSGTPSGTEVTYAPGMQLSKSSVQMTFRKIAETKPL